MELGQDRSGWKQFSVDTGKIRQKLYKPECSSQALTHSILGISPPFKQMEKVDHSSTFTFLSKANLFSSPNESLTQMKTVPHFTKDFMFALTP